MILSNLVIASETTPIVLQSGSELLKELSRISIITLVPSDGGRFGFRSMKLLYSKLAPSPPTQSEITAQELVRKYLKVEVNNRRGIVMNIQKERPCFQASTGAST
jgi:hypothetical protein